MNPAVSRIANPAVTVVSCLRRRPANHRIVSTALRCAWAWLLAVNSAFAIDKARLKTHVDEAIAKYGVTGSNVIIAILDRGIDWKNADFRNPDGTTRIEYIFDMLDNTGAFAPGNTWGVGTIYTKAQINTARGNKPRRACAGDAEQARLSARLTG